MAFLYVNADGISRPYSTINDALNDASHGDTICIDPGTYNEQVLLDKHVNIRGLTDTPENSDIIIRQPGVSNTETFVLNFDASEGSTVARTFYFEGVTFGNEFSSNGYDTWTTVTQGTGANRTSLIFNRCIFKDLTGNFAPRIVNLADTYFHTVRFDHCKWDHPSGGSQFNNAYWTRCDTEASILACEYTSAKNYYSSSGSPDPHNYVTTTTSGYGPSYSSDYYIQIPYGYFEGYVREQGSVVERNVYLYDRTDGTLMNSTVSDASGYYYMETVSSGSHFIVCTDDPAEPVFNDLIIGDAYPTPV